MCGTTYSACGIDVHVEDDKIVRIEGSKGHPIDDGRLCAKGLAAIQLEYDPNRLQYPMKRVGERGSGKWQRISWDEAFDTITTRLKEITESDGPRAIGWIKGQGGGWEFIWEYCQRFMNALGSPNLATIAYNCHAPRGLGQAFTYGTMALSDYENTRCMLLWGNNPINRSASHIAVRVMKAKQRGAKLIVIDPRFSKIAAKADIYVQPRPCTDSALALGMLNVIIGEKLYDKKFVDKWTYGFDKLSEMVEQYPPGKVEEITWVPAETIRKVARIYATTKPALLQETNGIDQQPDVVQTTRALAILRAVTGNLDIPGGNVFDPESPPFSRVASLTMRKSSAEDLKRAFHDSVSKHPVFFNTWYISIPEMVDAILTEEPYPIKALIVQAGNPVIIASNTKMIREALKKVSLLVVFDMFMTATAELADIVLPAATFLERMTFTKFVGEARREFPLTYYQLAPKAVEPMDECKSDYDFISELARRMGYGDVFPWKSVEESIDHQLKPIGLSCKKLEEQAGLILEREYSPQEAYKKYEKFFAQPMLPNKVALYSDALERQGYEPLPVYREPGESPVSRPDLAKEYPLVCMASLKPGLYTHSQYRDLPWLREIMPDPWIEIHPQKAEELGIMDGNIVVVKSPRGSIELKCKVINTMNPRVVAITHGWGNPFAGDHPITNVLTPSEVRCPISDATSNRCFLVKVSKGI